MEKSMILRQLIDFYANGNQSEFASIIGVTPQTLSGWITRNTYKLDVLSEKLPNVSPRFLIKGEGPILDGNNSDVPTRVDLSASPFIADQTVMALVRQITELSEQNAILRIKLEACEKQLKNRKSK